MLFTQGKQHLIEENNDFMKMQKKAMKMEGKETVGIRVMKVI